MAAPATQISFNVFIREKDRNTCPAYNTLPLFACKRTTPSGTHEAVGGFMCVLPLLTVTCLLFFLQSGCLPEVILPTSANISRFAYWSYMSSLS